MKRDEKTDRQTKSHEQALASLQLMTWNNRWPWQIWADSTVGKNHRQLQTESTGHFRWSLHSQPMTLREVLRYDSWSGYQASLNQE